MADVGRYKALREVESLLAWCAGVAEAQGEEAKSSLCYRGRPRD
jgi:hypothetical protein